MGANIFPVNITPAEITPRDIPEIRVATGEAVIYRYEQSISVTLTPDLGNSHDILNSIPNNTQPCNLGEAPRHSYLFIYLIVCVLVTHNITTKRYKRC